MNIFQTIHFRKHLRYVLNCPKRREKICTFRCVRKIIKMNKYIKYDLIWLILWYIFHFCIFLFGHSSNFVCLLIDSSNISIGQILFCTLQIYVVIVVVACCFSFISIHPFALFQTMKRHFLSVSLYVPQTGIIFNKHGTTQNCSKIDKKTQQLELNIQKN